MKSRFTALYCRLERKAVVQNAVVLLLETALSYDKLHLIKQLYKCSWRRRHTIYKFYNFLIHRERKLLDA